MARSYPHLTFKERCQAKIPTKSGFSKGSIAQHPTLISVQTTPSLGGGPGVALQIGSGVLFGVGQSSGFRAALSGVETTVFVSLPELEHQCPECTY